MLTTSQEYDSMVGFEVADGKAVIPLNCAVQGDVTVIVYHARSTFGGKVQGKITSIKMCQLQLHTGFFGNESRSKTLSLHDLDQLDTADKYPDCFRLTLNYVVSQRDPPSRSSAKLPWDGFTGKGISPRILFSDREEQHLVMSEFGVSERARKKLGRSASQTSSEPSQDNTPAESPAHKPARPPPPGC